MAVLKTISSDGVDNSSDENKMIIRALALTVMDEINLLRAEHGLSQRTKTQLINSIKNKINSGEVD